jgi:hypothetical protein
MYLVLVSLTRGEVVLARAFLREVVACAGERAFSEKTDLCHSG